MPDIARLSELLVNSLVLAPAEKGGRSFLPLREESTESRLQQVNIFDVSPDSLVLKMDGMVQPSFFKEAGGKRRRCDYVIATKFDRKYYLIFVEMKSKNMQRKNFVRQFKGAECLVDYFGATLKRFHEEKDFITPFEKRFVVLYWSSVRKNSSRSLLKRPPLHDSPDRAKLLPRPNNPTIRGLVQR